MRNVLILCTGNSCRSIMAEALLNHLGSGRFRAFSAGSNPTGVVHPLAVETVTRHGITVSNLRSKSWKEFSDTPVDFLITVCDNAANEACPLFPGEHKKLHWSTPDPAAATGTAQEIQDAFTRAFLLLHDRIEAFVRENEIES